MTEHTSGFTFLFGVLFLMGASGLALADDAVTNDDKKTAMESTKGAADKEASADEPESTPGTVESGKVRASDDEDEQIKEAEEAETAVAVARPLLADPVQVYGWREWVHVSDGTLELKLPAKLDTGALTSSIHAENKQLFERDGKKWVRFVVSVDGPDSKRLRIEAPLVRIAKIKEPGGESEMREVVRLGFKIGERKIRAEFTLNNRSNMLNPVLIGRRTIKELGWVDSSRAYLADKKVMR